MTRPYRHGRLWRASCALAGAAVVKDMDYMSMDAETCSWRSTRWSRASRVILAAVDNQYIAAMLGGRIRRRQRSLLGGCASA
jgi:hypothetical protein